MRERVRTFNKHVLNPTMMHLAGRKHWYAGVIRHTGHRSGKHYATPIVAEQIPGGFVMPLPYGTKVDWLRNVLAAGRAEIQVSGQTHAVFEPEIIDAASAAPLLPRRRRLTYQLFGVDNFVKLKRAATQT